MTGEQSKAARKLLGWSQYELAEKSGVTFETIAHFEARSGRAIARTRAMIRSAFEAAGVEFIEGGQLGVRMRARGDVDAD